MSVSPPSVTIKNLESAFAGESMANRKYLYFARRCRALGAIGVVLLPAPRRPLDPPRDSLAEASIPSAISSADRPNAAKTIIERIETDPTIARRLTLPPAAPRWEQIDDDQLSQELAKAGQPAGLAKIGGKVTLIFYGHSR